MAKARTEARRLGSCRPSVPRFMRAFAPPRPAGRAPRKTPTSGTSAYFRCSWGVWGVGLPNEDTSGSTTDDRNVAAGHAAHVEKVIRGFLDEVAMGHLTRSSSRDKTEFKLVFDEIIENIKSFVVDDTKEKSEAVEDIFERSKNSFAGLLDKTAGEAAACFAAVARFIPQCHDHPSS